MTEEPKRPIEKQLESLAARRRAAAGGPFTLPAYTRKLLLDEAMRVHPLPAEGELKTEANPMATRFLRMWRWLAVGVTAVFVLLIIGVIYLPSRQAKTQLARADRNSGAEADSLRTRDAAKLEQTMPTAATAGASAPSGTIAGNKAASGVQSALRETAKGVGDLADREAQRKGGLPAGNPETALRGNTLMDRSPEVVAAAAAKDANATPPGRALVIRDVKPAATSEVAALEAERAILAKAMAKSEAREAAALPSPAVVRSTKSPPAGTPQTASIPTAQPAAQPAAQPFAGGKKAEAPAAPVPVASEPIPIAPTSLAANNAPLALNPQPGTANNLGATGRGGSSEAKKTDPAPAAPAEKMSAAGKPADNVPKAELSVAAATPSPAKSQAAADKPITADWLQIRQQFIQAERPQLRRNFNSPPTPTVLATFTIENQGRALRIVDADGSVYTGLLGETPADRYSAPRAGAPAGIPFRASGTSRTFNDEVVFDGKLTLPANDPSAAQIRGRVTIGERVQTDVNATVKK